MTDFYNWLHYLWDITGMFLFVVSIPCSIAYLLCDKIYKFFVWQWYKLIGVKQFDNLTRVKYKLNKPTL